MWDHKVHVSYGSDDCAIRIEMNVSYSSRNAFDEFCLLFDAVATAQFYVDAIGTS